MTTTTERDGTRPNPPLLGSLAYLVMNLPIGIATFTFVVTTMSLGVGTVIIWVGLAVLAVAVLGMRGMAALERMRVHAMLRTYVATPYRPAEDGSRWLSRVKDPATWKDMVYLLLMLPLGIAEFTVVVVMWSVGLYLAMLPLYWLWVPGDWQVVLWNHPVLNIDSWAGTLPFAGLGVLVLALAVVVTKGMGRLHAVYARAMLGPSPRRIEKLSGLSTAGVIDWSNEWPHATTTTSYRPVSR
jgi:Na+-transporting methylmalonyl-CoA/oxaloacetate decarboxylase gamma subunit